jgi:tetrahydromethanopterin S-methyltransferase subunit B
MSEEEVDDDTVITPAPRWWSLLSWTGRIIWAVVAGTVVNVFTGIHVLGTVVTVVLFVLTSAVVVAVRR